MKKFLSLLLTAVMASSMFAATAFAAGNVSATYSATEVEVGEEFTVTVSSAAKTVYMDDIKLRFDDMSKFEVVSVLDAQGRARYRLPYEDEYGDVYYQALDLSTQSDNLTWAYLGSSPVTYNATTVAVVTLKALAAGEYTLSLEEYSNYSGASDHTGYNGVVSTQKVTVKASEPADTNHITIDAEGAVTDNVVVWTATLTADLMNNLTAKLYKNAADETGSSTETLTLGEGVTVSGTGDVTLDVTYDTTANAELVAGDVELSLASGNYSDRK